MAKSIKSIKILHTVTPADTYFILDGAYDYIGMLGYWIVVEIEEQDSTWITSIPVPANNEFLMYSINNYVYSHIGNEGFRCLHWSEMYDFLDKHKTYHNESLDHLRRLVDKLWGNT